MKAEKTENLRNFLAEIHKKSLFEVKTFSEYCEFIERYDVEIQPTIRKNGEMQGYHFFDRKSGEIIRLPK